MQVQVKNGQQITLQAFTLQDVNLLHQYLQQLSSTSKSRFGPHPFDVQALYEFYNSPLHKGFVAKAVSTNTIIGYAIIKIGVVQHDKNRLEQYGLEINDDSDCSYAPSVADNWQGMGVGKKLFSFLCYYLQQQKVNRVFLWGGVQQSNTHAISYYQKNGFNTLGIFEYNGNNIDMMATI
jgi:diamine N-acetyltransferase